MAAFLAVAFGEDDNEEFQFYLNSSRMFSPGEDVTIEMSGPFKRRTDVAFQAFRIADPVAFFSTQENPYSPGVSQDSDGKPIVNVDLKDKRKFTRVESWKETAEPRSRRDWYWNQMTVKVPVREKGVYLITATAEEKSAITVVIITDAGLLLKRSDSEMLAYMVNRSNGRRIAGADLVFKNGSNSMTAATGDDGVAVVRTEGLMKEQENDDEEIDFGWRGRPSVIAFGESNGSFVISDSYYYRSWGSTSSGSFSAYIYTERPVYRPSQVVYFRGIGRKVLEDGMYALPGKEKAAIEVRDARGGEVLKDTVEFSEFGTFTGEMTLGDEPPLGSYSLSVTIDGEQAGNATFYVEEYKKPEYEVVVTTPKESYSRGETIKAVVDADYYFGAPVAEGTVRYRVLRSHYWRPWWIGTEWAGLYKTVPVNNPYGSEYVDGGEGTLNSDGTFSLSFKAPSDLEGDYNYTIVAEVTDASRRTIGGSKSVRLTRGEFFMTARSMKYVYEPDENVTLNVGAWSFDGEMGVATSFSVAVEKTWWDDDYRNRKEEQVWSGSGRTGENGTGTVNFALANAGYYTATISATDSKGNEITTSSSLYVAGEDYAWRDNRGTVQVIPDRDVYKPGDVMSALVIMPVEGADVLVTAEGPTIFAHQVERLSGNSAIVRIPIESRYAPTFFPSVSTIVGDRMYTNEVQVSVAPEEKLITIEIETDKEKYKPGEQGTVTVRALNEQGEPVPDVELGVGVVDEAIYAIRPETATDIGMFFYGQRYNQVNTTSSLNFQFYSRAEAGLSELDVLRSSSVGSEGFGIRGGRAVPMEKELNREADVFDQSVEAPATVRKDFQDLMFWTGAVRTDSRGYATIPVTFPDNLTTWRITARGVTRATQVGQASAEVIATKDLLVRMETPRFITKGDELTIATNVHNYLSTAKDVRVTFRADGAKALFGSNEMRVTIPANGEKRLDWKVKAETLDSVTFTVKAFTDEESDAMELTVPVLPQGIKTGVSGYLVTTGQSGPRDLRLAMVSEGQPETSELHISLAPSSASSMLSALDDLIGYPYGCVEQTMSRFLPTVVVGDVLQELRLPFDEEKRAELPKMVDKGVKRLSGLQHDDGGWGWWENDESNPFMTAYVMYGLTIAKRTGYQIPEERYGRGLDNLYDQIERRVAGGGISSQDKRLNATTEAYMLYVASLIDSESERNGLVRDRIDDLSKEKEINTYAVALLAMAAHHQGDAFRAKRLAERIRAAATEVASTVSWSGQAWHYNWEDDEIETSAAAVKALLLIEGESEMVRRGVQWLLTRKSGSSWHNTRQTAMVVYTLAEYLRESDELNPDFSVTVRVNGTLVLTRRIDRSDVFKPAIELVVGPENLRKGDNVVTVEQNGEGRLYSSMRLLYYATGDMIEPSNAGFSLKREYFRLERDQRDGIYFFRKKKLDGPVRSGEELFVKLTFRPERGSDYVMVEDPLPAGVEVITDSDGYNIEGENGYGKENGTTRRGWSWGWNWWYADRSVRDEKVAFFATSVEAREYVVTYLVRAQIPGRYSTMPAVASLMYYPEVRGNSGTRQLVITD